MLYCFKFNLLLNEVLMLENFVSNDNNSQKINSENLPKKASAIFFAVMSIKRDPT